MFKILRVLLIVTLALTFFSGAASAYTEAVVKKVDVNVDGKIFSLNTKLETVGQVLSDMSIILSEDDTLYPTLDTEIENDMTIRIQKAFMVTVSIDGAPRYLRVAHGEIKTAKNKMDSALKTQTTLVGAKETDPLVPGMTIELVTSHVELEEERSEIPFDVVYVDNPQVDEGVETVLEEGFPGISVTTYEVLYDGGKAVSRTAVATSTETEKKDKVIERGTKLPTPTVPSQFVPNLAYSRVITLEATAYTTAGGDAGPITATGERCRVGLVAVDPSVIPLGTMLYVEGYGVSRAADTGGAIKGNRIDLFFNTYSEMIDFGRRNIKVYILEGTREELQAYEGTNQGIHFAAS